MRPMKEKLRYILRYGKLIKEGDEWVYYSEPGKDLIVMRGRSRWEIVEKIYDFKKNKI